MHQELNYLEELFARTAHLHLIQKYIGQQADVYYAVHKAILNSYFACKGCKYAKVIYSTVEGAENVKITTCKLKDILCAENYFRTVHAMKRVLVRSGILQESAFRNKVVAKVGAKDVKKPLKDWTKRDFSIHYFKLFKDNFQYRLTEEINKQPISRAMNVLYNLFEDDFKDYKFYLLRYINYSFKKAKIGKYMPSIAYMTNKKYIKDFIEEDSSAKFSKCDIYNLYCPYFKKGSCTACVKCTKLLRKKIKKHYN